ncbi:MAG TPA: hypothetical protein VF815_07680 [Myxococcaceae bacterium]
MALLAGGADGAALGKDGGIDNPVHDDELRLVRKSCNDDELMRYCGGDKQNTPECIRKCG